ncbi:hypothetical protein PV327_004421 [Microctonus hyperodae]|uniref:Cytochrome P450 n=1 Tax=Microctonus hyperodae TaxID=165561 RepID=A0AA39FCC4_MICHY|nr:hypothetical protein PV327_004421 [Microctonus hyperodae]
MTRQFKYWKKRSVIEIKPTPIIGNLGDLLTAKRSAAQWVQDIYNYGAGSPYVGFYLFDQPCLLIRDPELIKNVLVRDFNYFQDRYACASPDDKLACANLFLMKNPTWKMLRSKLTPVYTSAKLKKMFALMMEVGDDLDTHMASLDLCGQGANLEMKDLCLLSIFFMPKFSKPLGFKLFSESSRNFLRQTTWDALAERERSGIIRDDLVGLLVELKKAYYKDPDNANFVFDGDNLVAQLAIFFTAGFERFLDRVACVDYKVPNSNLIIEKGTPVFIPMMGLHYDPQYFPEPDKYDPERFTENNKKLRKSCVYFPFGEGPHICIGMRIGLLQVKLGLVKLLMKHEFSPCKDTIIPLRISPKCLTTTSEEGIFLNVKKLPTK